MGHIDFTWISIVRWTSGDSHASSHLLGVTWQQGNPVWPSERGQSWRCSEVLCWVAYIFSSKNAHIVTIFIIILFRKSLGQNGERTKWIILAAGESSSSRSYWKFHTQQNIVVTLEANSHVALFGHILVSRVMLGTSQWDKSSVPNLCNFTDRSLFHIWKSLFRSDYFKSLFHFGLHFSGLFRSPCLLWQIT